VTKLIFATNDHGSDGCWSKFLNAGNFSEAGLFVLGGDVTGDVVFIAHHEMKDDRITLLDQVFDVPCTINFQPMLKTPPSMPGLVPWAQ
jgi:Icc-related predicted phosphoesterase